jgi:hypothetical protein
VISWFQIALDIERSALNQDYLALGIKTWAECTKLNGTFEVFPFREFPRVLVHLENMTSRSRKVYSDQTCSPPLNLEKCLNLAGDIENQGRLFPPRDFS